MANKKTEKEQKKPIEDLNEKINYIYDLNSYQWKNPKLTVKEKMFVFYVASTGGGNLSECARKAGYSKANADVVGSKMNLKLKDEIELFTDRMVKISISKAAEEIIRQKTYCAIHFDPTKTWDIQEGETTEGVPFTATNILLPEKIDPMDRKMIKGIKVNQRGSAEYVYMDKEQAQKDILAWNEKINGDGGNSDEMDVNITLEGIKSDVKANIAIVHKNKEFVEQTDFIDSADSLETED